MRRQQLDRPVARLGSFWVRSGLGACRIEPIRELLQGVGEQVPVAVHRDLDRAMPKMRLNRLRVGTLRD
jgi:hypothetical protein